jgi:hypothetical protein
VSFRHQAEASPARHRPALGLRAGTDDLVVLWQAVARKEGKIMMSFTSSLLSRSAAAEPSCARKARSVRSQPRRGFTIRPRLEMLEDRTLLSSSGPASKAVQAAYGQLPLAFEANVGQAAAPINFVAHGSGYTLALTPSESVLALQKPARTARAQASGTPGNVVQLQLVGANPAAPVIGLDELITKTNYFIGNNPSQWRTNIPNFGKVEYQNVYPGINLVYYGNQGQLEYDFVVAPGVDPSAITLALAGTQGITLDSQGNLVLHTSGGEVLEHAPVLYQETDGVQQAVWGRFVLEGSNRVGFQVGAYDPSRPLVIDPVLSYSTYLGDNLLLQASNQIAVDSSGNAYITGETGANFPATLGAFQTTFGGPPNSDVNGDAYVAKLNANGTALVYATFLGGTSADAGLAIAAYTDSYGNTFAYVTGSTDSIDFPTTAGALQTTFLGNSSEFISNAFLTKLNASGTALLYSTYLGGHSAGFASGDYGDGIAVDSSGYAYITGSTTSSDFPITTGAYQTKYSGGLYVGDAFVAKINPFASGSASLVYSTYLGGSGDDWGNAIALDNLGNAYVAGSTGSSDFPTTPGAYQRTLGAASSSNAFLAKLNTSGTALLYSTYLGGSNDQSFPLGIALDASGNAYLAGFTTSSTLPTTTGAFQTMYHGNGGDYGFVAKLNTNLSGFQSLVYSTFLGGSSYAWCRGIGVDASGNAYVTGQTYSSDFPTTAGAYQMTTSAGWTDFVTKLNASGTALLYSTFFGGNDPNGDWPTGIAVDASGNAYITGATSSPTFPITPGAYDSNRNGGDQGFVTKLALGGQTVSIANPTNGGLSMSLMLTASDPNSADQQAGFTYSVNWGDNSAIQNSGPGLQTAAISHAYSPGVYVVQVTALDEDAITSPVATAVVVVSTATGDSISLSGGASVGSVLINGSPFPSAGGATQLVLVSGTGGSDTYTVNFGSTLRPPIAVIGTGSDTLTVNGSTDPNTSNYITNDKSTGTISWGASSVAPSQITTYSGLGAVIINGGAGPNYITDPGARTTINGGPGQNTIVITATSASGVVLNGGPSSSTNHYIIDMGSLLGPVTINSTTGTCTVTVNDPPGSNVLTLTSTQLTGDGETINFNLGSTATNFTVAGGGGNNNQLVEEGTPPGPVTAPNVTQIVLTPGVTLVGTQVYIVGGNTTNDQIQVNPVGTSMTGSTGVQVKGSLNGVATTMTFPQAVTFVEVFGFSGNDTIQLAASLTVSATISAGNGNDTVQAGSGPITVTLGNGNDTVLLGKGNNTITLGNGNDVVQLGSGNNVVVTGKGNNTIQAGNGDNLIAAGLGQHTVQVGNGSNILIDGTVTLTQSGDSLRQVLTDWISYLPTPTQANIANIRSRLHMTYNTSHANTLLAGSGLDWFWETYAKDTTNRKASDLLN